MHIICLTPLEEGVYNDIASENITTPPDGWAYIPEDFPLPSTFPRLGSIKAEEKEIDGRTIMTVTEMTEGTLPEPVPEDTTPTEADDTAAMLIDHEYRLALLELGISEY